MKHLLTNFASHVTTLIVQYCYLKKRKRKRLCSTFSEQNSCSCQFPSKLFLSKGVWLFSWIDKSENNFQFSVQKVTREQRQSLLDLDKLDSARKRLQENYQEAQNGKLLSLYLILNYRQTT
jgi:hypothetical protein